MANEINGVAKKLHEHYSRKRFVGFIATTSKEAKTDLNQIVEMNSFRDEIGVIGRKIEVSNIVDKFLAVKNQ